MEHLLGLHSGPQHLNRFKRLEIKQCLASDHGGIKLEMNNIKIAGKSSNNWRLNNILLSNTWVKEEISREIFKYFELNENDNVIYQNLWALARKIKTNYSILTHIYGI